jgi:hypothetical protein
MRVKAYSYIENGIDKATIEIDNFTSDEKTQATQFGTYQVNFGGVFAKEEIKDANGNVTQPAVNYSLAPINRIIDPNAGPFKLTQNFNKGVEYPIPGLSAQVFCTTNMEKVVAATQAWKALTDQYIVQLEQNI